METKSDFADEIRYMLDLELKSINKMTKDDLEALYELFNTPAKLMNLALKRAKGKFRDEILQKKFGDLISIAEKEEGLLGFGIIRKIKNRQRLLKR